jgi:hypothetical protein
VVGVPARIVRENGRRVAETVISGAAQADPCEQCLREFEARFAEFEKRFEELHQRARRETGAER